MPVMGAFWVAAIAALIGVIFWGAVRSSAKQGAKRAIDEHEQEKKTPEGLIEVDGKVYVDGKWISKKRYLENLNG